MHSAPPAPDYELLFADEFDGARVDDHDWNFRTGPRIGTGRERRGTKQRAENYHESELGEKRRRR